MTRIQPRLLIVEDEHLMGRAVARFFTRRAWTTRVCRSLEEARHALSKAGPWDACILDVDLPDGCGLDLLEDLGTTPHPVTTLVMTSHTDRATLCRAQLGWARFLPKPPPLENLGAFAEIVESTATSDSQSLAAALRRTAERFRLSAREAEVVERFARGTPRPRLARELGVAETTVRTLIRRTLLKSGHASLKALTHEVLLEAFGHRGESDTENVTR